MLLWAIHPLVAGEVLFVCERSQTAVASEPQIVPRLMILLDMGFELPFFRGSFPSALMRGPWTLPGFRVYLHVLCQLACSKLFARVTAARPIAMELLVHN